jgi:formylglycine-generating enzyme
LGLSIEFVNAQPATYTNSIGMEFVLIKPGHMVVGKFQPPFPVPFDTIKNSTHRMIMWMGDKGSRGYNNEEFRLAEQMATKDARPGFEVGIPTPYYIGKFEVTQAQWKKVMKKNPSVFQHDSLDADNHPVENITWDDAKKFIKALNRMEGKEVYRLPTEFEWEYAARGGMREDIPWTMIRETANLGTATTQPVGKKKPNGYGLYDMLGNVWEWVEDFYNEKLFADPVPSINGKVHVLKGASFVGDVKNATYMTHAGGPGNGWDVGFRVLRVVQPEEKQK